MPTKSKPRTNIRAVRLDESGDELIPFEYSMGFGPGTAAPEGKVLLRISRNGRIMVEEIMDPSEFLPLADAFENVARGIRNVLDGRTAG